MLTVVVAIAITTFGGNTQSVQVPVVQDQAAADAIAALQDHGFTARTHQLPDASIPPDHVIGTDRRGSAPHRPSGSKNTVEG